MQEIPHFEESPSILNISFLKLLLVMEQESQDIYHCFKAVK